MIVKTGYWNWNRIFIFFSSEFNRARSFLYMSKC